MAVAAAAVAAEIKRARGIRPPGSSRSIVLAVCGRGLAFFDAAVTMQRHIMLAAKNN